MCVIAYMQELCVCVVCGLNVDVAFELVGVLVSVRVILVFCGCCWC